MGRARAGVRTVRTARLRAPWWATPTAPDQTLTAHLSALVAAGPHAWAGSRTLAPLPGTPEAIWRQCEDHLIHGAHLARTGRTSLWGHLCVGIAVAASTSEQRPGWMGAPDLPLDILDVLTLGALGARTPGDVTDFAVLRNTWLTRLERAGLGADLATLVAIAVDTCAEINEPMDEPAVRAATAARAHEVSWGTRPLAASLDPLTVAREAASAAAAVTVPALDPSSADLVMAFAQTLREHHPSDPTTAAHVLRAGLARLCGALLTGQTTPAELAALDAPEREPAPGPGADDQRRRVELADAYAVRLNAQLAADRSADLAARDVIDVLTALDALPVSALPAAVRLGVAGPVTDPGAVLRHARTWARSVQPPGPLHALLAALATASACEDPDAFAVLGRVLALPGLDDPVADADPGTPLGLGELTTYAGAAAGVNVDFYGHQRPDRPEHHVQFLADQVDRFTARFGRAPVPGDPLDFVADELAPVEVRNPSFTDAVVHLLSDVDIAEPTREAMRLSQTIPQLGAFSTPHEACAWDDAVDQVAAAAGTDAGKVREEITQDVFSARLHVALRSVAALRDNPTTATDAIRAWVTVADVPPETDVTVWEHDVPIPVAAVRNLLIAFPAILERLTGRTEWDPEAGAALGAAWSGPELAEQVTALAARADAADLTLTGADIPAAVCLIAAAAPA